MKQALYKHHKDLILVCAWCGPSSFPKLAKRQAFTHGICPTHKEKMLAAYRQLARFS